MGGNGVVIDYDRTEIPETYDRGHDHGAAVLDLWMQTITSHVNGMPVRCILDLACGTGRFAPSLADHFNATVIGLDPSLKMLERAQPKCRASSGVRLAAGFGETLPLRSSCVDVVFSSMAYHHFAAPVDVARECARVLRPGGKVFVRTITADRIAHYPYVPFFPATRQLLEDRLPTVATTRVAFEAAGFRTIATDVVIQEIAPDYKTYAGKLAAGADTTLNSLPRDEFASGLEAMKAYSDDEPVIEPIDLLVFERSCHTE